MNKIIVNRESYSYEGKEYFNYFINGNVRGKEIRIKMTPPDRGGYKVLDLIFGEGAEVELTLKPYEIKDARTGRVTRGNTYFVTSSDENGDALSCQVKPYQASDKSLLEMITK